MTITYLKNWIGSKLRKIESNVRKKGRPLLCSETVQTNIIMKIFG